MTWGRWMLGRSRWRWFAVGTAVAVLVGAVALQVTYVRLKTGRWAATVSSVKAPWRIAYQGRDYDQGDRVKLPRDAVRRGNANTGLPVFKATLDGGNELATVIYVVDGKTTWAYGLVGGP